MPQGTSSGVKSSSRSNASLWVFLVLLVTILALVLVFIFTKNRNEDGTDDQAASTVHGVTAGTAETTPVALASGLYDSMVVGSRGELRSEEDIQKVHRRLPTDPFAIGAVDAPVVVSEFADFECPFCAHHATQTEPQILEEYVKKGLVRIEWNDLPVNGENARYGAYAGRAAAEQGKFQDFKEKLFAEAAKSSGHPNFSLDDYVRIATEAGVPDIDKFRADADSDKYEAVVSEAHSYASGIGVNGTPSFIVGTSFVRGARDFDTWKMLLDQELEKVSSGEVTPMEPQKVPQ